MSNRLKQLHDLGKAANLLTGHTLNCGGCCVFAVAVTARLRALGDKAECVMPSYLLRTVEQARSHLLNNNRDLSNPVNWDMAGLSFAHVGVRLEHEGRTFVYDSDALWPGKRPLGLQEYAGGVRRPRWYVLPDALELEEAQAFADDAGFWNCTFDRAFIPHLQDLVQTYLH